jgi:hypothetical protein
MKLYQFKEDGLIEFIKDINRFDKETFKNMTLKEVFEKLNSIENVVYKIEK